MLGCAFFWRAHQGGARPNAHAGFQSKMPKKNQEKPPVKKIYEIQVYLDDGRKFVYRVDTPEQVREHTFAIATTGYRHCVPGMLEHYPAHRILKVKGFGADLNTNYPAVTQGT